MKTEEDYTSHAEYVKTEGELLKMAAHSVRDYGIPNDVQFYRMPDGEIYGLKKYGAVEFTFLLTQDAASDELFIGDDE